MKSIELKHRVLELLRSNPDGIPQSYLVKALKVSKSHLSVVLRELESMGLIYRVRVGNMYIVKPVQIQKEIVSRDNLKRLKLGIVWSSEYPFIALFVKKLRDLLGIHVDVIVYPNALQTTYALIRGEVDTALSPLITQLYAYTISRAFYIVGAGAYGGAAIFEVDTDVDVVISSETSTMDVCRAIAIEKGYIDVSETRYFYEPEEAIRIINRKRARYAVLWSPLTHRARLVSKREIVRCDEFEELRHCCTYAISKTIPIDIIERIAKIYRDSIEEFTKSPEKTFEWYSAITGIDVDILKRSVNEYGYRSDIDMKSVRKLISTLGMSVPQEHVVLEAILIS